MIHNKVCVDINNKICMRTSKYTVRSPLTLDYEMYCTRLILFFSSSNMKMFDNERCEKEILPVGKKTNGTAANQIVGKHI